MPLALATHRAEMQETRTLHAAEMDASRRDAAAAWKLAKDLESRVLSQAKLSTANTSKYSKALDIGRRIESLDFGGSGGGGGGGAVTSFSWQDEESRENDRRERELERELQLGP